MEVSTPAAPVPAEEHKKRKITYTKPSVPHRSIEPFNNGLIQQKIYPLSNYTITPKTDKSYRDHEGKEDTNAKEALKEAKQYKRKTFKSDQIPNNGSFFKSLKKYNDLYGTRRYVQFLIVVGGEKDPIVLLLKEHNQLIIPGGYLTHEESESDGAKRILKELLDGDEEQPELKLGDTVARWWRTDLKPYVYPYLPRHVTRPKELVKVIYVELPTSRKLSYPEFYKSLSPYPLVDLYDKPEPELKSIPLVLSKYAFCVVDKNGKEYRDFTEEYDSTNQVPKV